MVERRTNQKPPTLQKLPTQISNRPIFALAVVSSIVLTLRFLVGLVSASLPPTMESDDDIHRASDVESADDDEDYYNSDDADADSDDNEIVKDADSNFYAARRDQQNFTVLKAEDIRRLQEDDIRGVSSVLSIPRADAIILLHHYSWSVSKVHDAWFADEEGAREAVGLLENPVVQYPYSGKLLCGICFEYYPGDGVLSAACGHPFCRECWASYMSTSINDGPGCLALRCPAPSCGAAVGQDMISLLAPDDNKEKYSRYLLRSYVEDSRKIKWCPAPGCEHAVELTAGSQGFDVSCHCSYSFCWNCIEEAHRPVDCGTVAKWILKNSTESENQNWILVNSKPCPKCKRPIEKNLGCMHMTCTPPCKFQFCWLCLGDWSDHRGSFYACNRYEEAEREGAYDESERIRQMAKESLDRYAHYYERWAGNQSSRQKALADLHEMQTVNIAKLIVEQCQSLSQLKFIIEAWQQIVECRRVLRWTYAYGYYLPEHEHAKKQFFEYLQGEAESGLERLHHCAEKELYVFLRGKTSPTIFNDFRNKLAGLTSVTRTYFENLVEALESGLSDVGTLTSVPSQRPGLDATSSSSEDATLGSDENFILVNAMLESDEDFV